MNKQENAIALFDEYNKQDPHLLTWEGKQFPAEYFYALQLYNWVLRLEPEAAEPLLLASRSQHIGRWKIPRERFPMNKAGYLNWRSTLSKFHAATAAELMKEAGYEQDVINAVRHIILKENIKSDREVQVMENALCLVFLEFQFHEFQLKHDDDKLVRIIQKSWKKMSQPGRDAALNLPLDVKAKAIIQKALQTP